MHRVLDYGLSQPRNTRGYSGFEVRVTELPRGLTSHATDDGLHDVSQSTVGLSG